MVIYEPFKLEDWKELKDVALKSWQYTYKNIYSQEFINNFIEENYSKGSTNKALSFPDSWHYIAKEDNKLVGYLTIGPYQDSWRLYRIYLLPEYIGKGIGQELLKLGEDYLRSKNAKKYCTFVQKDNEIGKSFYLKSGFTRIPEKDEEDELCLEKNL